MQYQTGVETGDQSGCTYMLAMDLNYWIFKTANIFFADAPFDVSGCDSVTFHSCRNAIDADGFTRRRQLTSVIDLSEDLDILWGRCNRTCRRFINRAQRSDVTVLRNECYKEFFEINHEFMRKKRISVPFGLNLPTLEVMKQSGELYLTDLGGVILGGHLYLVDEDHIRLWISASRRLDSDRETAKVIGDSNRLLHWEAIKWAKEQGIGEFDWGGFWPEGEAAADPTKAGINSFKQSFGGKIVDDFQYQKVYSPLYRVASKILQATRPFMTQ